jgi:hypothetical protein
MEGKQIYALIPKVMADIGAIGKDRKNEKQGYKFRGIDDVYNAANGALSKHGVFCVPEVLEETRTERTNSTGTLLFSVYLKVKYIFFAPDGSSVEAVVSCEGFDSGDKATNKALSAGQKYAFLQVFCIPTEEQKDSEVDDHEVVAKQPEPAKVVKETKAKRSDWYYTFRDAMEASKTVEELVGISYNVKKHLADLSDSEKSDLRNLHKKINNKLLTEGK